MSLNHTFSRRAALRAAIVGGIGLAVSGPSFASKADTAGNVP